MRHHSKKGGNAYFAQIDNMPHNGHKQPTQRSHCTTRALSTLGAPTWSKFTFLGEVLVSKASSIGEKKAKK
jgi:hypothetical protein